jgi:hypothetical protein
VPRDGEFELRVPAGGPFEIVYTSHRLRGVLTGAKAGDDDLRVVAGPMPMTGSLTVRMVDPDGSPLAGVEFLFAGELFTSDDAGVARVKGVRLTWEFVSIQYPGRWWERGFVLPKVRPCYPDGREVVLRFRRAVPVEGRVLDTDGTPVPSVHVSGLSSGTQELFPAIRTDAQGRFTLLVPEHAVALRLFARGQSGEEVTVDGVEPGDRDVVLRFP